MTSKALREAARAYMAQIGAKGGKTKGESKARPPEHYKRLADMRRAKAKARAKGVTKPTSNNSATKAARHVRRPHCISCGRVIWSDYHETNRECDECREAHGR